VRSELDSVASTEELARLLAEQYVRADVSLRELELRARRAGGTRLARATCSDMLAGRRFPKKAVMVAFLRACQVPEEQLPGWERAWERVRISQIATTPVSGTQRDEPVPPSPLGQARDESAPASQTPVMDHPVRGRRPTWRRIAVPAGLAGAIGLVTVIGVATLTDSDATARRVVIDDGRAFGGGGSSRFVVTVDPASTEVRLTRRLDAGIAKQTAIVTVDGAVAAVWQPLPAGPHGWRDQRVVLPATLTMGRRQFTITNTFVSSDLDFNEFIYFIDHKLDGVWSRADTLDVGPHHLDSEAAHHYRITNQTWADTNPFTYLG
jgi:hypothetical protein